MKRRCTRLLRSLPVISLAVTTLLAALMSVNPVAAQDASRPSGSVSAAVARGRIGAHVSTIENRFKAMNELYVYGAAERTLQDAFRKQGVTYSLSSAGNWGNNGLWPTWEQALVFYRYHLNALRESLNTLPAQGSASENDLAYLDAGMRGWGEHERQLDKLMQEMVALYAMLAVSLDKRYALKEKYALLLAEASKRKDFRRSDALRAEEAAALKPLQLEADGLYQTRDKLRVTIEEHAKRRFFEAIKARAANPRTTSSAEEKKKPEPLVVSGKAPGAKDGEKP